MKEESEKVGLKLITSWEIDGETVETVSDFIVLGSRITADGDYSYEIKRHLLLACWERLRAEGEEGMRGSDGWMASLMPWT